jgi:hypothetical protein
MREPPARKVWETVGEPRLLVIGAYRMGFDLSPRRATTSLRVWIDYDLPRAALWRIVGAVAGHVYARWCARRMVSDAESVHFQRAPPGSSAC